MSANTQDILIEVTSTDGMEICKKVIEELVSEMITMGITSVNLAEKVEDLKLNGENKVSSEEKALADDPNSKLRHSLVMQQVRIVDSKGALKTVYPSRVDLNFGGSNKLKVVRCYDE